MTTAGDVSVRLLATLGAALALLPVGAFLIWRVAPSVTLALVNVVLIAGSLYHLFGPAEAGHEHAADADPEPAG